MPIHSGLLLLALLCTMLCILAALFTSCGVAYVRALHGASGSQHGCEDNSVMPTQYFPGARAPFMVVHLADAYHFGGVRMPISLIVMHATRGTDSLGHLTTDSPRTAPVSAHVLVSRDGTAYRLVSDSRVAWHAGPAEIGSNLAKGRPNVNRFSLGIELENLNDGMQPYPAEQLDAAAGIIAYWWNLYGPLPILAHHAIQSDKTDPAGFPWPEFYQRLVAKLRL